MDRFLTLRRELRREATEAESALWALLRGRQLVGFKFRRQYSCGSYILDFFCPARRLAIELDGGQHFDPKAEVYDQRRTAFLERRGIQVLRFATDLVFREREAVLEEIVRVLMQP